MKKRKAMRLVKRTNESEYRFDEESLSSQLKFEIVFVVIVIGLLFLLFNHIVR